MSGSARSMAAIAHRLRDLRPAIVHVNDLRSGLTVGAAARALGIPVVWHQHEPVASGTTAVATRGGDSCSCGCGDHRLAAHALDRAWRRTRMCDPRPGPGRRGRAGHRTDRTHLRLRGPRWEVPGPPRRGQRPLSHSIRERRRALRRKYDPRVSPCRLGSRRRLAWCSVVAPSGISGSSSSSRCTCRVVHCCGVPATSVPRWFVGRSSRFTTWQRATIPSGSVGRTASGSIFWSRSCAGTPERSPPCHRSPATS